MQLNAYTKKMHDFLKSRGWHTINPTDFIKSLVIESAEILEIFQWENLSAAEIKKNKVKMDRVENELADVFMYSFDVCALLGLDAEKLINKKLEQAKKKYPPHMLKSHDVTKGDLASYDKIKQEYRKKQKMVTFK